MDLKDFFHRFDIRFLSCHQPESAYGLGEEPAFSADIARMAFKAWFKVVGLDHHAALESVETFHGAGEGADHHIGADPVRNPVVVERPDLETAVAGRGKGGASGAPETDYGGCAPFRCHFAEKEPDSKVIRIVGGDAARHAQYEPYYQTFKKLYKANKKLYQTIPEG